MIYNATPITLSDILASASDGDVVRLAPGIYPVKLVIDKSLTLIGDSPSDTVIAYGDFAKKLDESGLEYTTFKSYTVAVTAPNVTFCNLTVSNTVTNPSELGQCVALTLYADNFFADNCVFTSTQDTVFCGPLPDDLVVRYDGFLPDSLRCFEGEHTHNFRSCTVEGSVDFIFGCGKSYFVDCDIISVDDGRHSGYVAAPAHTLKQRDGFCFDKCRFINGGLPEASIYLARPWRDFGKCLFVDCTYGNHIKPCGFDKWNDTSRDRTARFVEHPHIDTRVGWCKPFTSTEQTSLSNFRNSFAVALENLTKLLSD